MNTTARFREERSGGNEGTSDDERDGGLRRSCGETGVNGGVLREKNSHAVDTPRFKPQMAVFSTSPVWFCLPNLNPKFDSSVRYVRETPRRKKEKKFEKNLSRDVAAPTGPTDASPGVEKRIIL